MSGTPTSSPSLAIITTVSRPTMRSPNRRRKSRRHAPMRGAARPGMMQAIETARLSRRRSPHVVGHALERGREREHLDAHRGARQRDRNLQRGSCVGAHRAAAVDEQHDSRRTPRAAQPARRQRLAAGLQAGPQRASKIEASSPARRPPAARQAEVQPANERSRGIAPGAARRAATRARRTSSASSGL